MKYSKGIGLVAIIVVIAVLGALGGGIYMATQNNLSPTVEGNMVGDNGAEGESVVEVSSNTSLRALIARGQNLVCTFERVDENTDVSGTVYVSGDRVRGDFIVNTDEAGTINGHMIKGGDYIYSWSDATTQGSKMKADVESDMEKSDSVGLDDEAEYNCRNWNVDNSKFNTPSDIDFVDISALMQTGLESSGDVNVNQCATCDAAPDENSKEQCRLALGC